MKHIILTLVLVSSATIIIAQEMSQATPDIIKNGRQYVYENNAFGIYDLGPILQNDESIMTLYNRGLKSHRKGKTFGYITLGAIGVGVIGIATRSGDAAACDNCIRTGSIIGFISAFIVAPNTGSIALISHFRGKGRIGKAVNSFNQKQYDSLGRVIEQPKLHLAKSGVGISVSF